MEEILLQEGGSMRERIIEYIVKNNQLHNWDTINGATVYREGYYFSCNYLANPIELVHDMAKEFNVPVEDAEGVSPLWLAFIGVMASYGFQNDEDLESTLQKIWTENAAKYTGAPI